MFFFFFFFFFGLLFFEDWNQFVLFSSICFLILIKLLCGDFFDLFYVNLSYTLVPRMLYCVQLEHEQVKSLLY